LKIIGIVCSPRRGGNTEILVNEALKSAARNGANIELLRVTDLEVSPCNGCEYCHESGECNIKDDMRTVYNKMINADGIVLGSPVYFWSVSSQAKTIMDRTYALRYPNHKLKNKICGGIVVAGRRGCMSTLEVINNFFLGQDMIPVGLGIAGYGNKIGEVKQDVKAMKGAFSLGKQITEMVKFFKYGELV